MRKRNLSLAKNKLHRVKFALGLYVVVILFNNSRIGSSSCVRTMDGQRKDIYPVERIADVPQTLSKWFIKWLARTGLQKVTFHQLRHSHVSILISNGVDFATVSRRLSHAKISATIDTYTHSHKNMDSTAANI